MKQVNFTSPACNLYAGLYVHIPFCVRKCKYCDFLSGPATMEVIEEYLRVLSLDLENTFSIMREKGERISTVYFGGGTPSILEGDQLIKLIGQIMKSGLLMEDAEFTMEVNPGTVDEDKLRSCREAGVNRLSIGAQSFHDQELKLLGRIHNGAQAKECFHMARQAGFSNISMDLMACLPGQSLSDFLDNVKQLISLEPEHISAYSLIIEEGTPFYELYGPEYYDNEETEELDRIMYEEALKLLQAAGYYRYEISNYARAGFESRHNSSYWTGIPYYGCGLGASSFVKEGEIYSRLRKNDNLKAYLEGEFDNHEKEVLSLKDRMEEFMFLGLRMTNGISTEEFERRFCHSFEEIYGGACRKLAEEGLLTFDGKRAALSKKGLDLSNYCFSLFLLDETEED